MLLPTLKHISLISALLLLPLMVKAQSSSYIINEIMVGNVDEYISPTFNFESWVEIYNSHEADMPLGGCYLSDDANNLKKWQIPDAVGIVPGKGYKVIWFDNTNLRITNCPFDLDADGGTLCLSDRTGKLISKVTYPASVERASFARVIDGGNTWAFTSYPTPGADNSTSVFSSQLLDSPNIKPDSKVFDKHVVVSSDVPDGCVIYYTTDGTLPSPTNGKRLYHNILINETATLRFRMYRDGWLASPVTTRSYIKRDKDYQLPIVSIVSDPRFLYDDSIGIYVKGVNGKPGNGAGGKANWNMEWDRPVNMSYILPDGGMAVNKDVNMSIAGGWSRLASMKSFKLKGKKKLGGDRDYHYQFFSAKPFLRSRTIFLRNGGNDTKARFKDPAISTIIQHSGIDLDVLSYQPVHHFINGKYIGVINVREPSNKHFVYANLGLDTDEIDCFEINCDSAYIQACGNREGFERLYSLSANAKKADVYEEIKQWLDIDEYINFMAMSLYMGRGDWPHNNFKGYRKTDGGRLRLVAFDLDACYEVANPFTYLEGEQYHTFNTLYSGTRRVNEEIELVTIFLNLLKNDAFRKQFIDTFSIMGGSVFNKEICSEIIDSLLYRVEPMLQMEDCTAKNVADAVRNGLDSRVNDMTNVMRKYQPMSLLWTKPTTLQMTTNCSEARLMLNGIEVPYSRFDGRVFAPTKIKAITPAGFTFQGWYAGYDSVRVAIPYHTEWKYLNSGILTDDSWTALSYDDTSWSSATAPIDDSILNQGECYLRQKFMCFGQIKPREEFLLEYKATCPVELYVNGKHVDTLPAAQMTKAILLPASAFRMGKNILAVRLTPSEGACWDAKLTRRNGFDGMPLYSTDAEISIAADGNYSLTALFRPITADETSQSTISPVRINEVCPANTVAVNDHFVRSGWIELYNTTSTEIDLSGMYLSDDPDDPRKWTIEGPSPVIPPHGHTIVWCDKQEPLTQLHAPFKLSAGEGTITLSDAQGLWIDTFAYPSLDGTCSAGRYPDGADDTYYMPRTTICKSNQLGSMATYLCDQTTGIANAPSVALGEIGGTLTITYADRRVSVSGPSVDEARIKVYTLSGQVLTNAPQRVRGDFVYVDLSDRQPGVYIVQATDKNGHTTSKKFIVK